MKELYQYAKVINESAGNLDVIMYGEMGSNARDITSWMKMTPMDELSDYDVYMMACPTGRDTWGMEDALKFCDTVVIWENVPADVWEYMRGGTVYDAVKALGEPENVLMKGKWKIR
jgi:hypothetical protein